MLLFHSRRLRRLLVYNPVGEQLRPTNPFYLGTFRPFYVDALPTPDGMIRCEIADVHMISGQLQLTVSPCLSGNFFPLVGKEEVLGRRQVRPEQRVSVLQNPSVNNLRGSL